MIISNETIDAVHNSTDLVALVGEYTKLERRSGNDWWGCCPFHNEKTPSFHVDGDKHFYYCFSCKEKGGAIKFVQEMEKLSFSDAVTSLAKKIGIQVRYEKGNPDYNSKEESKKTELIEKYTELYERIATTFHYFLTNEKIGSFALDYIKKRGISDEIIKKFKLGYAPADRKWLKKFLSSKNYSNEFLKDSGLFSKNYPDFSFFSDRLMFPIFNRNGQVVAFGGRILHSQGENDRKYLNSSDLPQFKKRDTLYAFNFAKNSMRQNKKIIFCEGYMDCIAYHQCEIDYAVAPLGTSLTEEHIKMVRGFVETVFLSFDSDSAGQNATFRAILMCRKEGLEVKIIRLKGGKDPAEILVNYGKENLTMQVNNAILDVDYLLNILSEKYPLDTPDGKTKAALEFFVYVDSLKSDIQKESCLEKLSQTFNLKPEAVKKDFLNREQARERVTVRQSNQNQTKQQNKNEIVIPNVQSAELRGLLAVTADLEQFKKIRETLTQDDFDDPLANQLYGLLEACFDENSFSIPSLISRCENPYLSEQIIAANSSEVYKSDNISAIVYDTVKFVQKNKVDKRRNEIILELKNFKPVTEEENFHFKALLQEKLELDKLYNSI